MAPSKDEKQAAELIEDKGEILRLRAQMRRLEEERDLLKKPRGTLPGSPSEVPLYERPSQSLFAGPYVPGSAGGASRLLRLAE